MAKAWKIHYPASLSRSQPKNSSGSSSWNFQRDSESLDSQLVLFTPSAVATATEMHKHGHRNRTESLSNSSISSSLTMDSQDTLCHQVYLTHLKWQKATPTANYKYSQPGSQERGKEVNGEHQQHREFRPLWKGKNNTKVPHSPLKAQPSFPPLESATLFPQQQHQRSHPEENFFPLYMFRGQD